MITKKHLLILAGSSLMAFATSNAQITLVSSWDINEGSGNTIANNASTASNNFSSFATWGTASSAPNSTASLTFDGTNAGNVLNTNVSGTPLAINASQSTFVAWINPTAANGSILSYSPGHGATPGADLRLLIDPNGNLRAEVSSGWFLYDQKDFVADGWNMVAVVFDGNTSTSSFYIGGTGMVTPTSAGVRAIATAGSIITVGDPTETVNLIIGGDQAARSFVGSLDMIAAFNGAATEAQLDSIYATGIPEPSTYAMAFGALALVGAMIRRRAMRA